MFTQERPRHPAYYDSWQRRCGERCPNSLFTGYHSTDIDRNQNVFMANSHVGHDCSVADDVLRTAMLIGGHCSKRWKLKDAPPFINSSDGRLCTGNDFADHQDLPPLRQPWDKYYLRNERR